MKKYEIYYNDGVLYGTVRFEDFVTEEEREQYFLQEIAENNKNINTDYHISRANIVEVA